MPFVTTGLDRLVESRPPLPGRGRAALLCNATTISSRGVPTAEAAAGCPGLRLERIFTPQHGFAAEKQDNMIPSSDGVHARLRVPLISLYGEQREPDPAAFDGLDALIIDLQDVGTRVYTFLVTALFTIRGALARGVPVIVLDRPNPIGGAVDGPVLEEGFRSFVGTADTPLRHGLTAAEYLLYGSWRMGLIAEEAARRVAAGARRAAREGPDGAGKSEPRVGEAPLSILPLAGWRRDMYFDATGLLWTMPSPNMPALETAIVYPGQVLLEGTNLSEGRGTTRPFEIFGAPFVDPPDVLSRLGGTAGCSPLAGALLREVAFEPMFQKHADRTCRGFHIHVVDRPAYAPVRFTVSLLAAIRRAHGDAFAWREPPYEYEWERMPIDLLCGTDRVRRAIDGGADCAEIAASWEEPLRAYRERVGPLLLYDD
ncbi:MAG: DUF1343 domain-containing protein [Candidatus Eisenbacteria bacterium]|uniref:DUF1343 domain-containing protein n=1 Tax=Eiseniibacteriota bacterium TaxID=2212470 RepID=A0A937XAR1_UNCEI|nr:DUF1343 domain-containing protein [Candidatus Eisenbacteria bacterium]